MFLMSNFTPMEATLKKIKEILALEYTQGEIKSIIKIIFEKLKGYSQVDIIMHRDDELSDFIKSQIDDVLRRLLNHEPIQYIFSEAYFHGMTLKVTPDTLIPRPETEELVDIIIKENAGSDLRVLDIGTGSGAIAIALARSLRFPEVEAVDISQPAIEIATENAKALKVNVKFSKKDILAETNMPKDFYDIIVSNPPYITEEEKTSMETNVLDYEPHTALFVPDEDPLRFYRAITNYATYALRSGGRLYFEINSRYGKETERLLLDNGFTDTAIIKDMYGLDRFVSGTKCNEYDS